MQNILKKVRTDIEEHRLFDRGDRVVVSLSGGADSMALLHVLRELQEELQLSLVVAHANHELRGEESERDARFVVEIAESLQIPHEIQRLPLHVRHGMIQAEARRLRYRFLEDVRTRYSAQKISTGHNADDQMETLLFRLLRGTGPAGLAGIYWKRGSIVRPLLGLWREEVRAFLETRSIPFIEDRTNREMVYRRNRIRHQVIPQMERIMGGAFRKNLWELAESAQEEEGIWHEIVRKEFQQHVRQERGEIVFSVKRLRDLPSASVPRLLNEAYRRLLSEEAGLYRSHYRALWRAVQTSDPSFEVHLPHAVVARRCYENLIFSIRREGERFRREPVTMTVPGRLRIEGTSLQLSAQIEPVRPIDWTGLPPNQAYFDWDSIQSPLTLRSRAPGDSIRPLGMQGKKKVKEILIEAKVPRSERDRVPILEASREILWVVGYRIDDRFKVTSTTQRLLSVRISEGRDEKSY